MIGTSPAFQLPYNYLPVNFRVLWHQSLGEILRYPELPRKVLNFDIYPVFNRKTNTQMTLSSSIVTTHARTIEDTNVTEIWPAESLSIRAAFFYELKKFYNYALSSGEYLVWYPKDKTDKAFAILPLDLYAGDTENQELFPVHGWSKKNYRWLAADVHFKFKILKVIDVPEAIATLEGA